MDGMGNWRGLSLVLEGFFTRAFLDRKKVNRLIFISSGPKTAGEITNLGGNFSCHYFSVPVATKTVAAWSPVFDHENFALQTDHQ